MIYSCEKTRDLTSSEYLQSNLLFVLQAKKEKDVHLLSNSMLSHVTTSAAKLPKQRAEPQVSKHMKTNIRGGVVSFLT